MFIDFCKKCFQSLFNITPPVENSSAADHHRTPPSPVGGLGILTASTEILKPDNVIESSSIIKPQSELIDAIDQSNDVIESSVVLPAAKRERGGVGVGFLDGGGSGGGGGDVDGFSSCTESLGFESSNERSSMNEFENEVFEKIRESSRSRVPKKSRNVYVNKEVKKFPPPLSTFTSDGKPTFFLRPVRKDGRLELKKVKILRPEALRASREDGRLRLQLVEDQVTNDKMDADDHDQFDVMGKKVDDGEQFPASNSGGVGGGGDDCRWLHHQRHQNMHGWGQRCVTIR